jgi:AAHS family 4-hydroxybenzoate transporter-like MFS transporter
MLNARQGSTGTMDVRTFIDGQPVGAYQWMVTAMCGLIVFVDGFDAQAMGFVAPALTRDLQVSRAVLGSVISSGLVGMMVGALLFGPAADRFGRKPVLIASTVTFAIGSLLTATANTIEMLSAYRLLTGLGMGGAMPNAIALTSEFMPSRLRATAVTGMMCGFSLGAAVGGFVAAGLIPRFGWQSVFWAGGAIPLVIALIATQLLPESIRFLLGRPNGRVRAMSYLARIAPGSVPPQLSPDDDAPVPGTVELILFGFLGQVARLFTDGRALVTLLIWVVYFANLLVLYFLNSWLPTIMNDSGIRVETAIRVTALFQVGGSVGAILLGKLLDRRRSFGVVAVCLLWAAIWIFATAEAGVSVPLLIAAILASGVGVIGGQNASHALSSEFYPTGIRSTGVGWALGIGRVGSIVGPIVGGHLLTRAGGARQVLWMACIPALIAAAAAAAIAVVERNRRRP